MSLKLIETLSDWVGGFAVALTAFGAAAGLIAWYLSGKVATARQDALTRFQNESKVSIANANERAQEATARAEEARLKTAQIESLVEWRTFSKEQITKLESVLSTKPSAVRIAYVANDPEALFVAIQLSKAFTGWTVMTGARTYSDVLIFGLRIVGRTESDVNLVREAFRSADISFSSDPIPANSVEFSTVKPNQPAEPEVEIIVGSKPRPMP